MRKTLIKKQDSQAIEIQCDLGDEIYNSNDMTPHSFTKNRVPSPVWSPNMFNDDIQSYLN